MILIGEIILLVILIFLALAWLADSVGGAGFWSCLKDVVLGLGQWALLIAGMLGVVVLIGDIVRRILQ